jgi:hypothetical protein
MIYSLKVFVLAITLLQVSQEVPLLVGTWKSTADSGRWTFNADGTFDYQGEFSKWSDRGSFKWEGDYILLEGQKRKSIKEIKHLSDNILVLADPNTTGQYPIVRAHYYIE